MKPTFSIKAINDSLLNQITVKVKISINADTFNRLTEKFDYGMHGLGANEWLRAILMVFIEHEEFMDYNAAAIFTYKKLVLKTFNFTIARESYDNFIKILDELSKEGKNKQEIILKCIESKIKTKLL